MNYFNIKRSQSIGGYILALYIALCLASCGKQDSIYKKFIEEGTYIYTGNADSLRAFPGENRVGLQWIIADPEITRCMVYWDFKSDSMVVPIKNFTGMDTVHIIIDSLTEGSHEFEVYTYDDEGHSSVGNSVIASAFGARYIAGLNNRIVESTLYLNDTTIIVWGTPADGTTGVQLDYTDTSGASRELFIPSHVDSTFIADVAFTSGSGTLRYRTLYVPDPASIDTFYTEYKEVKVIGPRVEYDRNSWTALAEDYDVPSGRVPQNALDNNTSTVWHMDKTHSYPHHITIDMHTNNKVNGFFFIQRKPLDGAAKLIEIEISSDNVKWESLGAFNLENSLDKQFIELPEPLTFRYFRITVESDYKGGQFTAIAEIGAYKR